MGNFFSQEPEKTPCEKLTSFLYTPPGKILVSLGIVGVVGAIAACINSNSETPSTSPDASTEHNSAVTPTPPGPSGQTAYTPLTPPFRDLRAAVGAESTRSRIPNMPSGGTPSLGRGPSFPPAAKTIDPTIRPPPSSVPPVSPGLPPAQARTTQSLSPPLRALNAAVGAESTGSRIPNMPSGGTPSLGRNQQFSSTGTIDPTIRPTMPPPSSVPLSAQHDPTPSGSFTNSTPLRDGRKKTSAGDNRGPSSKSAARAPASQRGPSQRNYGEAQVRRSVGSPTGPLDPRYSPSALSTNPILTQLDPLPAAAMTNAPQPKASQSPVDSDRAIRIEAYESSLSDREKFLAKYLNGNQGDDPKVTRSYSRCDDESKAGPKCQIGLGQGWDPSKIKIGCKGLITGMEHNFRVCQDCLRTYIMEHSGSPIIYCPTCRVHGLTERIAIGETDIAKILVKGSPDYITFYERKASQRVDSNGKWCQKCDFGMLHKHCAVCPRCNHKAQDTVEIDIDLLNYMKKSHNFKQCPSCTKYMEKNSGCNHMTCNYCRTEWCWICLKIYEIDNKGKSKIKNHYDDPNTQCYGGWDQGEGTDSPLPGWVPKTDHYDAKYEDFQQAYSTWFYKFVACTAMTITKERVSEMIFLQGKEKGWTKRRANGVWGNSPLNKYARLILGLSFAMSEEHHFPEDHPISKEGFTKLFNSLWGIPPDDPQLQVMVKQVQEAAKKAQAAARSG